MQIPLKGPRPWEGWELGGAALPRRAAVQVHFAGC